MHLIPRRFENHTIGSIGDDLSLTSMGFVGILLVKSEHELEAVQTRAWARSCGRWRCRVCTTSRSPEAQGI
ncbi:hypothetical protein C8J55DRAFT_155804 [Lentinula edodes]|uniref:ATP adenylyltransferase C-terminal domain-containing protein n=1 Tax=Lentinula lateritia TaxID=40482 RepID=A0A9W9DIP4_9AGAR|nr:hypothetical protein C8J55DRAFT_155804 [Lentinula edodes]